MDASTAVQILGTIAETYGAILAIGAGFFTFLIQRLKEETKSLSERLEKDIDLIVDNYDLDIVRSTANEKGEVLEYSPDLFKENTMKNGPEWIISFLRTEMPRVNLEDSYFQTVFRRIEKSYPRFKKLSEKGEELPYRLFIGFLFFCGLVIISSFIAMGLIDTIVTSSICKEVVWFQILL